MSFSLNKVILAGTLTDQPSVRRVDNGKKVISLSVVTMRRWQNAENVDQQSKEWHRIVVIHDPLVAYAESKLSKDDDVYIEGEMHTELWRDETYEWRTLTKVVLWQEAHQLRILADCEQHSSVDRRPPHLLYAAREAHLLRPVGNHPASREQRDLGERDQFDDVAKHTLIETRSAFHNTSLRKVRYGLRPLCL